MACARKPHSEPRADSAGARLVDTHPIKLLQRDTTSRGHGFEGTLYLLHFRRVHCKAQTLTSEAAEAT